MVFRLVTARPPRPVVVRLESPHRRPVPIRTHLLNGRHPPPFVVPHSCGPEWIREAEPDESSHYGHSQKNGVSSCATARGPGDATSSAGLAKLAAVPWRWIPEGGSAAQRALVAARAMPWSMPANTSRCSG